MGTISSFLLPPLQHRKDDVSRMSDTEESVQTDDITWSHAFDLRIKERSKEAENNLTFLEVLGAPREELVLSDSANFPYKIIHMTS
eukprot:11996170-Ditylum_brightwellii.AAC.1